ncbi:MAG: hypothetical protein BYD32DRAFT_423219 [Podila humilis]|nr:MAG: hypothetical protein BYD32DRAFT_423219 [Podila humilis]
MESFFSVFHAFFLHMHSLPHSFTFTHAPMNMHQCYSLFFYPHSQLCYIAIALYGQSLQTTPIFHNINKVHHGSIHILCTFSCLCPWWHTAFFLFLLSSVLRVLPR